MPRQDLNRTDATIGNWVWVWCLVALWLPMAPGCGYFSTGATEGDGTVADATTETANSTGNTPDDSTSSIAPNDSATTATTPEKPNTTLSPANPSLGTRPPSVGGVSTTSRRPLMVGSFNIARFGESKSAKAEVMDRLMEITYPFDVLAIQEVVSQQEAVVQNFVDKLNTKYGAKFNYVVGPFVGRTNYVERAAYVYDTSRLKLVEQPFMIADPEDKLHREPLVARFQVREDLASNPFSFVMVNLHLDPDSGAVELDHVSDLLNVLESLFKGQEDDILLVGDFNLNPEKIFGETKFSARPEWKSVLDNQVMTNTRQNQAYDNVLYQVDKTREFLRRQGVIDLRARFRISLEEALEISDHLPIWAAFSLEEAAAQDVAAVETGAVR